MLGHIHCSDPVTSSLEAPRPSLTCLARWNVRNLLTALLGESKELGSLLYGESTHRSVRASISSAQGNAPDQQHPSWNQWISPTNLPMLHTPITEVFTIINLGRLNRE